MFQRILVPLDGSPLAEQALPVAAQLARACGGTLILLNAVDILLPYISYEAVQPFIIQEDIDLSLRKAKDYIERVLSRNDLAGIKLQKRVILGHPADVILSVTEKQAVDLIVMCSHGKTGLKHWLLGNTAEKVLRHSPVPVFMLHGGKPLAIHQRPDGAHFIRVIVPLDTSARSQDAIVPAAALVAALSSPGAGELHLIQIVTPSDEIDAQGKEALQQYARRNLQEVCESIRDGLMANFGPDLQLTLTWSVSLDNDIAEGIVRIAEQGEENAESGVIEPGDFIAMTTHGYTGIRRWTMGNIADRVLHSTLLSLLLVRPADMIVRERQEREAHTTPERKISY